MSGEHPVDPRDLGINTGAAQQDQPKEPQVEISKTEAIKAKEAELAAVFEQNKQHFNPETDQQLEILRAQAIEGLKSGDSSGLVHYQEMIQPVIDTLEDHDEQDIARIRMDFMVVGIFFSAGQYDRAMDDLEVSLDTIGQKHTELINLGERIFILIRDINRL